MSAMNNETVLKTELTKLRGHLQSELTRVEEEIDSLARQRAELSVRIGAIDQVVRSEFAAPAEAEQRSAKLPGRLNERGPIHGAYDVLKAEDKPMHVRAILSSLMAQGFRSNAKRPIAMLSGTMKRSRRFVLCGHDTWALAEWPEEKRTIKAEA